MRDLVTVIVPVYKVEKYLNKCVDSILNQSYRNLEIILVDDGSPDECSRICDDYASMDSRIEVIHKENGGLSSARNAALDVAKGDWILCVDSDDYIHSTMVEKMLAAAEENSADIVISSYYLQKNNKLSIVDEIHDEVIVMDKMTALDRLVADKEIKSYAWGKLYRAELFEGVRYPDGRNYEDIATTYYLFDKADKIIKIPEYLYYYLVRDDSISFNNSTVSWHKGCHASCLGQEERAEYFKQKGYVDLYEKAMAALLPYLFSDIKSAYEAGEFEDAIETQEYIQRHLNSFRENAYISDKDKKLIDVYLKSPDYFKFYEKVKKPVLKINKKIAKVRHHIWLLTAFYDFELKAGKSRRVVYFELPCFDNLGDHAIAYTTKKLLSQIFADDDSAQIYVVPGWQFNKAFSALKRCIGKDDVIVCQGGGNFGNLYDFAQVFRRKVLKRFRDNRIVIMPQTVFYTDDEKGNKEIELDRKTIEKCSNLTILARDKKSYGLFKQYFKTDVCLMRDVVTTLNLPDQNNEREGILLCLRSDKEGKLSLEEKLQIEKECRKWGQNVTITDTCTNYVIKDEDRERILLSKLELWSRARLVVTDRLHGMFFSLITKTPCIVLGNNHHKVREAYDTIGDCDYIRYIDSAGELKKAASDLLNDNCDRYTRPVYKNDLDKYKELLSGGKHEEAEFKD